MADTYAVGWPAEPTDPTSSPGRLITSPRPRTAASSSCWYEGWMIHDIAVPNVAPPRKDGHAQFGTITQRDAELLARMGTGNNVPGHIFTVDGRPPHFPARRITF